MEVYNLNLNIKESQIMTDRSDMANCKEISKIAIRESIKYLGMTIYCDR